MSRFVILFQEKEGTTALMEFLEKFDDVSIIADTNKNYEPFDQHSRGEMSLPQLESCLDKIFNPLPASLEDLNQIYLPSGSAPLSFSASTNIIGLKMRFNPPRDFQKKIHRWTSLKLLLSLAKRMDKNAFRESMLRLYRKHNVAVFISIRKDLLRWALSKYHGDGTGKPGHLQFKLASGQLSQNDIGKIYVDPERLARIIEKCEELHLKKHFQFYSLNQAGIRAFPLFYEDFLYHKPQFFRSFFQSLGRSVDEARIASVINENTRLQKVHSDDISSFVTNHEEIIERFGNRRSIWQSESCSGN